MSLVFLQHLSALSIFVPGIALLLIATPGVVVWLREQLGWCKQQGSIVETARAYFWPGLAIGFAVWIAFWSSLLPPTQSDALRYHLTVPELYLRHGGFVALDTLSFSNFPFLIEYLFLIPLEFGSIAGPKLIHFLFFIITLLQAAKMANHWGGRRAGVIAALLIASTPFVPIFASWAFIEFALSAYTLFAIQCAMAVRSAFVNGERSNAWRWAILLGVVGGLLLGCKYTALATVAFLGLALLWPGRAPKLTFLQRFPIATTAIVLALLIASPWYIKNIVLFSNPVFPFGGSVFPTHEWTAFNQEFFSYHAGMKGSLNAVRQSSVIEKVTDFITLPFRATLYSSDVYRIENFGDMPTGVLWLAGALLAIFCRSWRAGMPFLGGMSVLLFVFWGATYRDLRFLLPCLVTAAPLLGVIWSDMLERTRSLRWFIVVAVFYNLMTTHGLTLIPGSYMPWMLTGGQVDQETYLLEISDETRHQNQAFHFLEQNAEPQTRVLLHGIQEPFYCKNDYVWADWFDTDVLISWSWQANGADALLKRLQAEGIEYLALNYGNINQYNQMYLPYYRLFRLPREKGLPLLREFISKEYARLHYPYEYNFWIQEFVQRLSVAEAESPNVAALEGLLHGGLLEEVFRYDEKPDDLSEGIVVFRVPTQASDEE
ncbi:MAG: glycosyltransferase family 39 protein [Candidatus Hinthialibacter antarcticus]|nr:glycosyltransferase family 39 protein [Candidatus Hinthialibacter antarcticus]